MSRQVWHSAGSHLDPLTTLVCQVVRLRIQRKSKTLDLEDISLSALSRHVFHCGSHKLRPTTTTRAVSRRAAVRPHVANSGRSDPL